MTASNVSGVPTSYGYDHTVQRMFKSSNNATTTYPNRYYTATSATTTKHIYTPGGDLITTITTNGATTTKQFIHTDHLGGTNIVSDGSGVVVQALDYYPYGSERVTSGTFDEQRTFIGEESDDSGLSYLNARYYDGGRGQFLSIDPSFLTVGTPKLTEIMARARNINDPYSTSRGKEETDQLALKRFLSDPQLANSYSYSRNNPITFKDQNGEFGVFVQGDVGGASGLFSGFAGSASIGGGFTIGDDPFSDPVDIGGYSSYGGLVGGAFHSTTINGSTSGPNNYGVFGLAGGASVGLTFTNATRVSQLGGTSVQNSLNVGIGTVSWSVSDSGLWTITIAIGAKPAISFSDYPTQTGTATLITTEKKDN